MIDAAEAVLLDSSGPLEVSNGEPRLVAGRCGDCDALMFPIRPNCPACGSGAVERTLLPRRGALWTWTTQGFAPGSPPYLPEAGEFVPFALGYVEFPGYLRVEGRLTESDPDRLRIGMAMEVVVLEHAGMISYAFAPVGDDREAEPA